MEVKNFILILAIGIGLILGLAFIVPYASAYPYIQQGQTINQSETYDMTSVYGWTGKFAHWEYYLDENTDVEPDHIVDLNKMTKTYAIYIDPSIWVVGNWYQYDGKTVEQHGNTLAFTVNRTQPGITPTPTIAPKKVSPAPAPTTSPVNESATVIPLPVAPTTPKVPVVSATPTFPPPRGLPSSEFLPPISIILIELYIVMRRYAN